jgi:signal transduction histidine kinase
MKSYLYEINKNIKNIINKDDYKEILEAKSILIQLFSGEDKEKVQAILNELVVLFKNATIITTSTDGEIINDKVLTQSSILSITTFQKTSLKIAYSVNQDSFLSGQEMASQIITDNTKLLLAFTNGIMCNGEAFLNGIYSVAPDVMVAGGLSGDNAKFEECYVGIQNQIYTQGAVGVSLNSDTLCVENLYNFGWKAIGIKHTVTKARGNRVYTIDNMSAVDFYKKYLGPGISEKLPATGIEFPLIIISENFKKARAVVAKHNDGSLSFAGNVAQGDDIYIGVGEIETILSNHIEKMKNINTEAFFIYSCMSRRRFLPNLIEQEITPFAQLAPTSGFFTYGEFYTDKKPQLLNQTLTAVALSEIQQCNLQQIENTNYSKNNATFDALLHIIDVASKELQEQTKEQERINQELSSKTNTLELIQEIANLGSWELDLDTMEISWSPTSYKIYNISQDEKPPTYLEFLNMVLPQDREKVISIHKKIENNYSGVHTVEIRVKRPDGKIMTVVESGKLVFDDGKPIKIVGSTLDITRFRAQDTILIQQSKSAQMGEMINMIAHQWRQPLNAISSASIKLKMQSDMGILTQEEVNKTTLFIEEITQKMSQTINDFMNFTKPNNQKELVDCKDVIEDILKIIGTQLKNHDIVLQTTIEQNMHIFTYKKELEHILINIIVNARDALESLNNIKKYININIYEKSNMYIIKISDNGGGIDEEIIDRIFDPYFTTKGANRGTGLGLYMSKKILQEHLNGDIFVRNHNNGAEFTILLDKEYE